MDQATLNAQLFYDQAAFQLHQAEALLVEAEALAEARRAAVDARRKLLACAEEVLLERKGSAPADVSPPQGDQPGAEAPPPSSPPAPDPPTPPEPEGAPPLSSEVPPKPKSRARMLWNQQKVSEAVRDFGVCRISQIAERTGLTLGEIRNAASKLVEAGAIQITGQRGSTRYHWQRTLDEEETPPASTTREPAAPGPPPGHGAPREMEEDHDLGAREGARQKPSFHAEVHSRLIIKPMTVAQMIDEWPEKTENEIRQALGENMKSGDVRTTHRGGELVYHGRM